MSATANREPARHRPASTALQRLVVAPIKLYQAIVPRFLPPCCRFSPSCSHYAIEAIQTHGVLRGLCFAGTRLLRCQPFAAGGWDPVPPPPARET